MNDDDLAMELGILPDSRPKTIAQKVLVGDCRALLPTVPACSYDSIVTDPPYELGFMEESWDASGVSFDVKTWRAILRVLRPGGYMLCFGGTRTYHRIVCAIEDAGFEIRDCLAWLYGTGFPKGQSNLKPAWEPIVLARKPGKMRLLSIDECRTPTTDKLGGGDENIKPRPHTDGWDRPWMHDEKHTRKHSEKVRRNVAKAETLGRYPANVIHDGSDEVVDAFASFGEKGGGFGVRGGRTDVGWGIRGTGETVGYGDTGTAARFFYCAKSSRKERGAGNNHPTVKPLALMRWLVRLITPESGTVLDPFAGSGSTLVAAKQENRSATGIEMDERYASIARRRVA